MGDIPSSDGIEFVSKAHPGPSRLRPDPFRTSTSRDSRTSTSVDLEATRRARTTSTQPSNVIELSDGSEDDFEIAPKVQQTRAHLASEDEEILVVGDSFKPARPTMALSSSPEEEDLEPLANLWSARQVGAGLDRSASMAVASTSKYSASNRVPARAKTLATIPDFEILELSPPLSRSPSPFSANPAKTKKGKGKQRQEPRAFESDILARGAANGASIWDDILGSDGDGTKRKKKGKGKAKAKEPDGRCKRLLEDDGSDTEEEESIRSGSKSPRKKAPRISANSKESKADQVANAHLSKAELQKQEAAARVKLRGANTLKTKSKTATAAELTIHVSGTAFDSLDGDSDDVATGKGRGKNKKKRKPSPWLEITEKLAERLKSFHCDVERPENPRRDVGCEGAIRWTRVCTTKWDDGRAMYLPLPEAEPIIIEEDTRLVFLTAHDLSHHVADDTLSSFMTKLQAQLASHVNLFILLYGLPAIYRDLERVRQAVYKKGVRLDAGQAEGNAIKPAGIGERQPSKDELELAIMRMQMKTRCMIVSVDKIEDAVDWLEQINFDVGQKPYQRLKLSHITMLGTGEANLQSGKDLQDTYIKMLASLKGVTDAVAKGIAGIYPTMRSLLEAWDRCPGGEREKREMLIGIGKGRNVNGTATHRSIGAASSGNIYRMLTSQDPDMFV
ncbi:hypothetical protein JCM16303_001837 [Sporobolomyces ruberrimus]